MWHKGKGNPTIADKKKRDCDPPARDTQIKLTCIMREFILDFSASFSQGRNEMARKGVLSEHHYFAWCGDAKRGLSAAEILAASKSFTSPPVRGATPPT